MVTLGTSKPSTVRSTNTTGIWLVDQRVEAARAAALRREHDAVDALVQERLEVTVLLLDVLVGVAEQRDVVGGECGLLCGVGDVGEERVTHVGHQQADRLCAGQPQRARLHVGSVSERGDRLGDAGPWLRGEVAGWPESTRDAVPSETPACAATSRMVTPLPATVLLLSVGTFPWERFHVM